MKTFRKRDPQLTKNGRIRLAGLGIRQLQELVEKASTRKLRGRARTRLESLVARQKKIDSAAAK